MPTLPEVHECEIVYDDDGRHVHTFSRMAPYEDEAVPSDFKSGKTTPVLIIAEHRITQAVNDENRLVMVLCDGVRFIIEVTILPNRHMLDFGEFSRFEVNDVVILEKLIRSLTTGKQDAFWDRIRVDIERTKT